MSKVCPQCACKNPLEASFCYFDGADSARHRRSGPVQAGTVVFSEPFVFANGDTCKNFNQLAMGCQRNWEIARDLLTQGVISAFLQTIGRKDLAKFAGQCRDALDADQALDQLLEKFPVDVLQPAKLAVEPTQVNLGQVRPTGEAGFDLLLSNQGLRLLIGTVSTDCDWLVLGDGPGQKQKMFQTIGEGETHVPVKVKGPKLRAGAKPFVGRLMVESNAGTSSVKIQLSVPILPFPQGNLQGAVTPRELAVKARESPKDAAPLFEAGAVGDWYKSNGWIYPVDGPSGSGLGAVQQYFEALGLTKPPRLEISEDRLAFQGTMGERIAGRLQVSTPDKRPVFAHAWCDQPWVTFADPQFQGAMVRLPFEVAIPPQPGETLQAKIMIRGNGNQRFQVPVTLSVDNVFVAIAVSEPLLTAEVVEDEVPVPPAVEEKPPVRSKKKKRKADPYKEQSGTFGMVRLVYWSSLIGGWSAFVGWLIAELCVGSSVTSTGYLIAMIVMVASALGAGLSQTEGLLTGQWQSQLRQLWPGLLGGFVGGLAGGLLGNFLHVHLSFLGFLARVLGWTVLGLFIGVCQGILHGVAEGDWRKFRNGLIGGGLGGFLGGLFFNPIGFVVGSPVSSRAFAFVLLGLCIGLFLSLVQVLLKEAWLTVEEGFRPGRQLIMDQPVITMGTSEKASLIFIAYGAKGVEPVHLRIRRKKKTGQYVLHDNESRGGTLLNGEAIDGPCVLENGDVIQLGINKVRFHERVRRRNDA